jgi:hypothetical protein
MAMTLIEGPVVVTAANLNGTRVLQNYFWNNETSPVLAG